ncbi:hypothetical protein D3C72_2261520 [compost metagenome]
MSFEPDALGFQIEGDSWLSGGQCTSGMFGDPQQWFYHSRFVWGLLRHYPEPWVILSLGRFEEQLKTLDPSDPQRENEIQLHQTMLSSSTER